MKKLNKNHLLKNILSALAIAFLGFILLSLAFLIDFLFQIMIDSLIALFTPVDFNMDWHWFPPLKHVIFLIIICLISWFVFRSKLKDIYKAIYMTVPVAVVLVTVGMFLYQWPWTVYLTGSIFCLGVLYYLYRTKQPWLYYYAMILVGLAMAVFTLLGGEI